MSARQRHVSKRLPSAPAEPPLRELELIPIDSADVVRLSALLRARLQELADKVGAWGATGVFAYALRKETQATQTLLTAISEHDEGSMLAVDSFLRQTAEQASPPSTLEQRLVERSLAALNEFSAGHLLAAVRELHGAGRRCPVCGGDGWCGECEIREHLANICVAFWQQSAQSIPEPRYDEELERSGVFRMLVRGARTLGETARRAAGGTKRQGKLEQLHFPH